MKILYGKSSTCVAAFYNFLHALRSILIDIFRLETWVCSKFIPIPVFAPICKKPTNTAFYRSFLIGINRKCLTSNVRIGLERISGCGNFLKI